MTTGKEMLIKFFLWFVITATAITRDARMTKWTAPSLCLFICIPIFCLSVSLCLHACHSLLFWVCMFFVSKPRTITMHHHHRNNHNNHHHTHNHTSTGKRATNYIFYTTISFFFIFLVIIWRGSRPETLHWELMTARRRASSDLPLISLLIIFHKGWWIFFFFRSFQSLETARLWGSWAWPALLI